MTSYKIRVSVDGDLEVMAENVPDDKIVKIYHENQTTLTIELVSKPDTSTNANSQIGLVNSKFIDDCQPETLVYVEFRFHQDGQGSNFSKIPAIKAVRSVLNIGLGEAKAFVENTPKSRCAAWQARNIRDEMANEIAKRGVSLIFSPA